jgi:hypothetical protein
MDERGGRPGRIEGRLLYLAALGMYTSLSVVFFGRPVLDHFSRAFIGSGIDPTQAMWALVWWPYAVRHGLNPFFTDRIWAPHGASLAWITGVPGASLVAAPITLTAGPVVAYNVLSLLAPALAASTAYLVCRYLTKRFWPSVVGGGIFGFSPYEMGHLRGHLNLMLIFLIPLGVYLVLLRLDRVMKPWTFVLLLGLVLSMQFLFSNEIFATLSAFGAAALGLAYLLLPGDLRPRLRSIGLLILCAYGAAVIALSPYLYSILAPGVPRTPFSDPEVYTSDLLNFVIPTPLTLVGGAALEPITRAFSGNYGEEGAYLGVPLLLVVALFAQSHWRRPGGKLLLYLLGTIALASLGPTLHIAGHRIAPLPWTLVLRIPVLNNALPGRFIVHASFVVAIVVAMWLNTAGVATRKKWLLVSLGAITLMPNLWYPGWATPATTPPFIADRLYKGYLHEGETVLVIPYGANGNGMLWQAETEMHFRMAEGVGTGSIPRDFFRWPINYTFYSGHLIPDYAVQLKAYLAAHAVRKILVVDGTPGPWPQLFATLETEPVRRGGVSLYEVPQRILSTAGSLTPLEIETRSNLALAASLIAAANYYTSRGTPLAELTPLDAERRGLLPVYWGGYAASEVNSRQGLEFSTRTGLRLGPWEEDTIGVGLIASAQTIGPLIARYAPVAERIYFPYPQPFNGDLTRAKGILLIVFTRDGIRRAAAMPQ